MFLHEIPDIQNLLKEVFRIIQNGLFDIHVATLSDIYLDGKNIGGSYKSKTTYIKVGNLTVKLSNNGKSNHWSDIIELTFNNIPVNLTSENINPLLIDIANYFKENY